MTTVQSSTSPALGSDVALALSWQLDGSQRAGYDIRLAWPEDSASHPDVAELQNAQGRVKLGYIQAAAAAAALKRRLLRPYHQPLEEDEGC